MDTMGIVGFAFGSSALSAAIIAWSQIASLKKELEDLKTSLEDSGVLRKLSKTKGK